MRDIFTTQSTVTNRRPRRRTAAAVAVAGALILVLVPFESSASAATTVPLGTTASFAVLAGAGVTNTGPTVITGDVGMSPTPTITGFPPGTVVGTQHAADAVAGQAKTDLVTAYNAAAGEPTSTTITADLGGSTLVAGVYTAATSMGLTGALTLNAAGDPNAVFVFQAGSTLTTASASSVVLTNGAQACNVFWQVGSSATLGTGSTFRGTVLAMQSITVTTGVTVAGRVLARNGAVTLDTDTITPSVCAPPVVVPPAATVVTPTVAPPTIASAVPPLASTGPDHVGILLAASAALLAIGTVLVATGVVGGRGRSRLRP